MMIEEKNQMLKKFQMLTSEYVSKIEESIVQKISSLLISLIRLHIVRFDPHIN